MGWASGGGSLADEIIVNYAVFERTWYSCNDEGCKNEMAWAYRMDR